MRTDNTPPPRHFPTVTVETNAGGDMLPTSVRESLAHLPVHVQAVTRTRPTEGVPRD